MGFFWFVMMVLGMLKHMTPSLMTFVMVAVVWMVITARVGRNFLNRCRVICHVAMRMLMRWTVPAVRGMTRMPMWVRMDCMLSMWVSSVVRRMRRTGHNLLPHVVPIPDVQNAYTSISLPIYNLLCCESLKSEPSR